MGPPMNGITLRRVFAWVFAIATYAALVDLCLETFAAGSWLRWYVVVVSVAFFGVSGLLWRSNGASAKAEYAFIVLAALFAYAGWALGFGDARTLHAFGQPTSVLAAGMLLVALAVSSARLLVLRRVPALVPVAAGVLVLYASLPLVAALFRGGLDAALDGTPLGVPGSFWSRGAFLGIEVVLPFAVLVFAAATVVTLLRHERRAAASTARIALALLLVMQMGALEIATLDLPSLASFERPHGTPPVVAAALGAGSQPGASPEAASGGDGIGSALGGSLLDASDALSNASNSPRQRVAAFLGKVAIAQRYVRRADFDAAGLPRVR